MRKTIFTIIAVIAISVLSVGAKNQKVQLNRAVYLTSLDCENCAKKIRENVSFEKGVKDLKVDVPTKTVEIQFDVQKTDTLQLKKAINRLGYDARLVDFETVVR